MLFDIVILILYIPLRIIDFAGRWGNSTTENDVINELHPTQWKITQEVSGAISTRKKEGGLISASTYADCVWILRRLVGKGWAEDRKRGAGPFWEFKLTGEGLKHKLESSNTVETSSRTAEEHG